MPFTPPDPDAAIRQPTTIAPIVVRPLAATDAAAARALFTAAFGNTLYAEAPRTALARALGGPNGGEAGGIVAVADDQVVGVAVYGFVPGTDRTAKMHGMAVAADSRRHGVARTLIAAFVSALAGGRARLVVVEFPDAPELAGGRTLLLHSRFAEEARMADYFLDGIALAFLRRDPV
jgi:ribosomal protein S18 acetylase RimI-like enzyme